MLKKIYYQDIIYSLISLISLFISLLIMNSNIFFSCFFWIIVTHIIFTIIYLNNNCISLFSISGLFVLLSYFFHFGQLFLKIISPNYVFVINDIINSDKNNAIFALILSFATIYFVVIGIRIMSSKKVKSNYKPLDKKIYFIMAIIILFISFPIKLYIDINKVILFFQGGYNLAYRFRLNGIFTQISSFYFVGFIILILLFKNNKKIANTLTIFLLLYQCFTMLTGNRGIQLIHIVFILMIYYKYIRQINKFDIIFLILVIIFGTKFISVMSIQRANGFNGFFDMLNVIFTYDNTPILGILEEFGYTLQTVTLEFRNDIHHTFGLTYIYSFFGVLPNIGRFLNTINYQACFVNMLNYNNIGGSYIGELFYNFSYLGPLFGIGIGIIVEIVSSRLELYIKNNRLLEASCFILPSISILWWVRNYFKDMPREFIWGIFFMIGAYKLSNLIVNAFVISKDSNEKKVSIIMGVYNTDVSYLSEAINSILNQTYRNIEFVIVDDCSTNSATIEYLSKLNNDNRIKLIRNKQNIGLTKSLNIALENCTGDFIARMDSDDISELDRIEYQVDYLNNHLDIDVLSGSAKQIGLLKSNRKYLKNSDEIKASLLFNNNYVIHPTVMFRKKSFQNELRYNEKYPKAQDYALWCELIMSKKFQVDDRIVLNYRIHESQASIASSTIQLSCAESIRKKFAMHLLTDKNDIEFLNDLASAQILDIDTLENITFCILKNNKEKKVFIEKYLINELRKVYSYQFIKILLNTKYKINVIKKCKHKSWFGNLENIKNLYGITKNYVLRRK